jgi:hypothetical protein
MFKALGAFTLASVMMASTALADNPCPGATAATPATPAAPAQAQRQQPSRSYSYQPGVTGSYRQFNRGRGWSRYMRPADSKALGQY